MSSRFTFLLVAWVALWLAAAPASALVTSEVVTPESVKQKDSKFTVGVERDKDGLIQFTITYRLPRPQYLVAHLELREGETLLATSDTPSFAREATATF